MGKVRSGNGSAQMGKVSLANSERLQMHYQIYIPGVSGCSPEHLQNVGLGDLFDPHCGVEAIEVLENGPDKGRGMCFFWQPCPVAGYHPERQQWVPAKAAGKLKANRFWMGRDNFAPVQAVDLLRTDHLGGLGVRMADGEEWLVPVARKLPHKFTIDEDGRPRRVVKERYEAFFDTAYRYFCQMIEWYQGSMGDITIDEAWNFACSALMWNYRLNADVIAWLGLLDDRSILELIAATHEVTVCRELAAQKKTTELSTLVT
jgi:hypothetical protein